MIKKETKTIIYLHDTFFFELKQIKDSGKGERKKSSTTHVKTRKKEEKKQKKMIKIKMSKERKTWEFNCTMYIELRATTIVRCACFLNLAKPTVSQSTNPY